MLSIKAIKQGQDNSYYFEKDNNYYFKEDQEHLIKAFEWGGKGAIAQGLTGQVTQKDFERVMAGILPGGQQLGVKKGDEMLHRPGFDLTFSAPKSVSILALVGGDDRLLVLHQQSVATAMQVVERLAQARVRQSGETTYETTRNLTFAQFMHDTSREGDPQLHTHVVVANMTQCADGSWRSLASDMSRQNGFYERVMNDRNYFGIIYRAELAKGLTEMGFELKFVGKDGLFEIEGVPPEVMKVFSKRHEQIVAAVKTWGKESVKAYDLAALNTRKSKTAVNRETLMTRWNGELDDTGWDLNQFLHAAAEIKLSQEKRAEGPEVANNKANNQAFADMDKARELIYDTVAILSQRTLSMDYHQILKQATEYGLGKCRSGDLVKAFDEVAKTGELIRLDEEGSRWTTKAGLETEVSLIDAVSRGKTAKMALALDEITLIKQGLNDFDKVFLTDVLGSDERINILQYSPEKKHEWLGQLLQAAEAHGKTVKILSPNAVHAQEVNEKIVRDPQSLWDWLKNIGKESVSGTVAGFNFQTARDLKLPLYVTRLKKGIVIVDGAQKITPEAMKTLFEVTEKLQAKVILLHETAGQHLSFQGDVMSTLKKADVHCVKRNSTAESKALPVHLHKVADDKERLSMVALHYAMLSLEERQHTVVVAQNQREAKSLNANIREQLKNTGELGRQEKEIQTLQPVFLSKAERKYAAHYEKGMLLRFYDGRERQELRVQGVLKEENTLHVVNALGKKEKIACRQVGEEWQIFQEKKIAIAEKESLMVTGNMKNSGLMKGERVTVKSLSSNSIVLETTGKTVKLTATEWDNVHVDHHYTEPLTQLRTETSARVLTSIKSRAINQETLHVLSQKSEKEIVFYSDDTDKVAKQFQLTPKRTTIIDEVFKASHVMTKLLTPEKIDDLKASLSQALTQINKEQIKTSIEKAVDYAIAKLSERNAGFTHSDLVKTAISHSLGRATLDGVEKTLRDKIEAGVLQHGRDEVGKTIWTTQESINLERHILTAIKQGKDTQVPLMDKGTLQQALEKTHLNAGQKEACYLIGTTTDRFVMIQGYAGTGKSTMLAELMQALKTHAASHNKPLEILGCAPTHQAVKELEALGVKAQTLKSLLVEHTQIPKDFSHTVVLLDEISMVSNRDFHEFQTLIEQSKGRAGYVGDIAQLLSVESGKPMEIALKKGDISVAYMTELVRQTNEEVKQVVQHVIDGKISTAFKSIEQLDPREVPREITTDNNSWIAYVEKIKSCVIEIPNAERNDKKEAVQLEGDASPLYLQQAVAKEYLSRTKEVRDNTITIVHSHRDRAIVHETLFEGLRTLGEIGKEAITVDRLVSRGLTRVEARHVPSYNLDDYIKIGKGDYMKVVETDSHARYVTVEGVDGKRDIVYPERLSKQLSIEVYQKEEAELSQGMRIKFTKTDKERQILANREWHVMSIVDNKVMVQEKNSDKVFTMDPTALKDCHWDHAYTVTGYGAQSSSYRYVIGHEASYSKHLANQREFYITTSRAKQHIMILTDDKEALLSKFMNNTGDKYAALEVIGEAKDNRTVKGNSKTVNSNNVMTERAVPQQKRQTAPELTSKPERLFFDAKTVEQGLKDNVMYVTQAVLGECNKKLSSSRELRYGNNGSLSIKISGDKQGKWTDFESGTGGGMIALISEKLNMSFKDSLAYGASLVNATPQKIERTVKLLAPKNEQKQALATHEKALKLVRESVPIKGTLAQQYLEQTRGVSLANADNLRFIPRVYTGIGNAEKQKYAPAMLSIAKDFSGKIKSVQVTYLDHKTINKADVEIKKRTYGSPQGASVLLQKGGNNNAKTYITEGVETGLSVVTAKPDAHVIATMGKSNFRQLDQKNMHEQVVFCLDNDGKDTFKPSNLAFILSAMERLSKEGKSVSMVIPNVEKNDLNDTLKKGGVDAVNETLSKEIPLNKLQEMSQKMLLEIERKSTPEDLKKVDLLLSKEGKFNIQLSTPSPDIADKILREQVNFMNKMKAISPTQIAQNQAIQAAKKSFEIEREI